VSLTLLHTSDWHLGAALYGRSRQQEHAAFLDWLLERLDENEVDLLILAGDVFDNTTPSHDAQTLYYDFLVRAARTGRSILVTAGNHDSATFLEAPKGLLRHHNIHVIGARDEEPEQDLITIRDAQGEPLALVCGVPYLRERDLGRMGEGEGFDARQARLLAAIQGHYAELWQAAQRKAGQLGEALATRLPIIATGHLYVAGGGLGEGRPGGERHIGSLGQIPASLFPEGLDYLALGHLHRPQRVMGREDWRYSGSPLPMSFAADDRKSVALARWDGSAMQVESIDIPSFRKLARVSGDLEQLRRGLGALVEEGEPCWVEVVYTGNEIHGNLKQAIEEWIGDATLEVLRIDDRRIRGATLERQSRSETLADLDPLEVFKRRLQDLEIDTAEREMLQQTYRQALQELAEQDPAAESG
jgi:exonuclease SbcD